MKLTRNQIDVMDTLANYRVGTLHDVVTSQYTAAMNPDFVRRAIGTFSKPSLRGLEKKGFIKIVDEYWRGARIKFLKRYKGD